MRAKNTVRTPQLINPATLNLVSSQLQCTVNAGIPEKLETLVENVLETKREL